MTKTKPSLLDRAKAIQKRRRQTWIEKLPVGQRTEVVQVINAKLDGEVTATVDDLVELFVAEGIPATINTLQGVINTLRKERANGAARKGQKPR